MLDEDLRAAKVAKFEDTGVGVEKKVLRLNIAVTDSLRMNVGKRAKELVDVELDFKDRHGSLHFVEVSGCAVYGLGDVLEYEVQIDLILLGVVSSQDTLMEILREMVPDRR